MGNWRLISIKHGYQFMNIYLYGYPFLAFGYLCLNINVDITTIVWIIEDWYPKIMDIHVDIRGFLEIHAWICYGFSDQGRDLSTWLIRRSTSGPKLQRFLQVGAINAFETASTSWMMYLQYWSEVNERMCQAPIFRQPVRIKMFLIWLVVRQTFALAESRWISSSQIRYADTNQGNIPVLWDRHLDPLWKAFRHHNSSDYWSWKFYA